VQGHRSKSQTRGEELKLANRDHSPEMLELKGKVANGQHEVRIHLKSF
jgi:hypothetical protein